MSYVMAESRVEWLPHGRAFSRADLDAMPDDGNRYEIIDGALIVTPSPSMHHQAAVVALVARLAPLCPTHLRVLVAPFDVELAPNTVVQPDLLIAAKSQLTECDLKGPPSWRSRCCRLAHGSSISLSSVLAMKPRAVSHIGWWIRFSPQSCVGS
jgi:hypothetical protein